jgi:hypothetical protein
MLFTNKAIFMRASKRSFIFFKSDKIGRPLIFAVGVQGAVEKSHAIQ